MERLPGLQARLHAYQEKTRNLELAWRHPMPVPTVRRSELFDYYFSWGKFDVGDSGEGALLAVFARNPNHKPNLRDPHGYMLVCAKEGMVQTVDDLIVIFRTHVGEVDSGILLDQIRIIKGIVPQIPEVKEEAARFTFFINKELAQLFMLAAQVAQASAMLELNLELERIARSDFRDNPSI